MRYSKEDHETAALICAIAASTPDLNDYYSSVFQELDVDVASPPAELSMLIRLTPQT